MERRDESQYREAAGGKLTSHPVCFHSGAFSIGRLRHKSPQPTETVIRFRVDTGHMIDVAISAALAAKLAAALVEGGAQ